MSLVFNILASTVLVWVNILNAPAINLIVLISDGKYFLPVAGFSLNRNDATILSINSGSRANPLSKIPTIESLKYC
jgi:hypothetical protein